MGNKSDMEQRIIEREVDPDFCTTMQSFNGVHVRHSEGNQFVIDVIVIKNMEQALSLQKAVDKAVDIAKDFFTESA